MKYTVSSVVVLLAISAQALAADTGVRPDHVDFSARFLETLYTDPQGRRVWNAFEIGSDLEGDPAARAACIRRQTEELRVWITWSENSPRTSSLGVLRSWQSRVSMNNRIPSPNLAIRWRGGSIGARVGTEAERQTWALAQHSFPSEWNGIRFNNAELTVSPYLDAAGQCRVVSRNVLEAYFYMIASCVSARGANCQGDRFYPAPPAPVLGYPDP